MAIKNLNQNISHSVTIQKATESDCKDTWIWRNDEQTRQMFTSTDEVSWEAHKSWYESSLKNKNRYMFIGFLEEENKIGICRFDIDEETKIAEVSLNLNPNYRNKKLSKSLLKNSIFFLYTLINVDLLAKIKKNNLSSIKCFESNGFILYKEGIDYNFYIKEYVY